MKLNNKYKFFSKILIILFLTSCSETTFLFNSVKKTSRKIMKPLLWIGFSLLTLSIINEEFHFLHVPEVLNYSAAAFLAGLHIYNLKYCQCDDEECCTP